MRMASKCGKTSKSVITRLMASVLILKDWWLRAMLKIVIAFSYRPVR
jgi:hypothetical protein